MDDDVAQTFRVYKVTSTERIKHLTAMRMNGQCDSEHQEASKGTHAKQEAQLKGHASTERSRVDGLLSMV